jgi:hypothetical protein
MSMFILRCFGAAKEVLQNSTLICTTAPWSWQLHGDLELGCLAEKVARVIRVQLWSHTKQGLRLWFFRFRTYTTHGPKIGAEAILALINIYIYIYIYTLAICPCVATGEKHSSN